jgi:tetratricopeptide (TPR) repeat protein
VAGAIADFDRALTLAPGSADALLNRGTARLLQGDAATALPDLEAAIRANPTALGWYNLASARAMRGELRAALDDCRRAVAAAPPGSDLAARAARKLAAIENEIARQR